MRGFMQGNESELDGYRLQWCGVCHAKSGKKKTNRFTEKKHKADDLSHGGASVQPFSVVREGFPMIGGLTI